MARHHQIGEKVSVMFDGEIVAIFLDGSNTPHYNVIIQNPKTKAPFLCTVPDWSVVITNRQVANKEVV